MILAPPVIAAATICAAVGATVLRQGLRGRPVDDHPVCAKCAFDLQGVYPAAAVCPECGAALGDGAVRWGNRPRRPRVIALGITLLLVAGVFGGVLLVSGVGGAKWRAVAPVWYLRLELPTGSGDAAMKELVARQAANKLSAAEVSSIADAALVKQGSPAPWTLTWGDFIEAASAANQLSPEQLALYVRQAATLKFTGRSRIEADGSWPYSLQIGPGRCGSGRNNLSVHAELIGVKVGDREFPYGRGGITTGLGSHGWASTNANISLKGLAPGRHEAVATWKLAGYTGLGARGTPVTTWEAELPTVIEVVGAGRDAVELITEPSLRDAVTRSITAKQLGVSGGTAEGFLEFAGTPVGTAFDVYWRTSESGDTRREVKVGTVTAPAQTGGTLHQAGYSSPVPAGFAPTTVDVVLRPSPAAARNTPDLVKIWGEEVVLRGVPVTVITPDDGTASK